MIEYSNTNTNTNRNKQTQIKTQIRNWKKAVLNPHANACHLNGTMIIIEWWWLSIQMKTKIQIQNQIQLELQIHILIGLSKVHP